MVKNRKNPTRCCFVCGEKIKNKYRNALYCEKCADVVRYLTTLINNYIRIKRDICPGYAFIVNVTVIKKRKRNNETLL